jgi:hypothetical protein
MNRNRRSYPRYQRRRASRRIVADLASDVTDYLEDVVLEQAKNIWSESYGAGLSIDDVVADFLKRNPSIAKDLERETDLTLDEMIDAIESDWGRLVSWITVSSRELEAAVDALDLPDDYYAAIEDAGEDDTIWPITTKLVDEVVDEVLEGAFDDFVYRGHLQ